MFFFVAATQYPAPKDRLYESTQTWKKNENNLKQTYKLNFNAKYGGGNQNKKFKKEHVKREDDSEDDYDNYSEVIILDENNDDTINDDNEELTMLMLQKKKEEAQVKCAEANLRLLKIKAEIDEINLLNEETKKCNKE